MSSQISPQEKIYTGVWTDHALGSVVGLTLTVNTTGGAYLIAFLAIFVRLAAGHFWDICCWVWFRLRRTDQPRDGLYHQQQALLRNGLSDIRALWQFSATAWAWRKKTHNPLLRSLPIILAALFHFVAFTVAGIFSSKVANVHANVLISGPVCGMFDGASVYKQQGMIEQAEFSTYSLSIWRNNATQSTSCHAFNTTGAQQNFHDFRAWGRQYVPYTILANVSCPFSEEMCLDGLAMSVESDLIDTTKTLGINAKPEDRFQFRHRATCAPIKIDGFKHDNLTTWNQTTLPQDSRDILFSPLPGYVGYAYGQETLLNGSYTFVYFNTSFGDQFGNLQAPSYMIDVEESYLNDLGNSDWVPIPELNRTDADVVMWFIMQNNLVFAQPSNDPIFGATVQTPWTVYSPGGQWVNITYWRPSEPLTVMACAQQWQWCNPNNGYCNAWDGKSIDFDQMNFNEKQINVLFRVFDFLSQADMSLMTVALGNDALLASTASGWGQAGSQLPDDQWMREVDHWHSIYWNSVQLHVAQYAVGNGVAAQDRYVLTPAEDEKWQCNAQVVQRSDYASFNMLGIILLLCFGMLFVVINLSIDPIYQYLSQRRAKIADSDSFSLWRRNYVLGLLSMVFEAAGLGNWEHNQLVPTTKTSEEFRFPHGQGKEYLPLSETVKGRLPPLQKLPAITKVEETFPENFWNLRDVDERAV